MKMQKRGRCGGNTQLHHVWEKEGTRRERRGRSLKKKMERGIIRERVNINEGSFGRWSSHWKKKGRFQMRDMVELLKCLRNLTRKLAILLPRERTHWARENKRTLILERSGKGGTIS